MAHSCEVCDLAAELATERALTKELRGHRIKIAADVLSLLATLEAIRDLGPLNASQQEAITRTLGKLEGIPSV